MDKIILNELEFYGYHGLFPEERKLGQRFIVDLELFTDLRNPGKTDKMNDSVHYGEVYEHTKRIVEGPPKKLIEAVAQEITEELFRHFNLLLACRVRVTKPNPPIQGHYKSVAVEIYREKDNE